MLQKPEWFKLDPAKFLSDARVDCMTTLELGACLRLLCRQWIDGFITDDQRVLARLCRLDEDTMAEVWVTLGPFFPLSEPGKRANRFMWIERERVTAAMEHKSDEGTRAARKRWDEHKRLVATPTGSPMPDPMQDQSRAEQSRGDQPPPPNGSPMPHPIAPASAIKDESDAATHDDLAVSQLARGLLENTGIPINPTIHQAVIAAIDARARERGEGFADAHDFIRDKVMKQKQLGQPDKWLFWFRDSKYEDQKLNGEDSISKSADGYEPRAPGDLPLTHQQRSVRAH